MSSMDITGQGSPLWNASIKDLISNLMFLATGQEVWGQSEFICGFWPSYGRSKSVSNSTSHGTKLLHCWIVTEVQVEGRARRECHGLLCRLFAVKTGTVVIPFAV